MVIGTCSKKLLVFAGTYEGHQLAEYFFQKGWFGNMADFCVATEYGTEVLDDVPGISIIEGRLSQVDMEKLIKSNGYGFVIDATHPYATAVTANIKTACQAASASYIRLLREETFFNHPSVFSVDSIEGAVELLNDNEDRVLLTTGSKELSKYAGLKSLSQRAVTRVLPTMDSLKSCEDGGFLSKNIICMQGPFSQEMNLAVMKQYDCKWLVTKNTGKPGGFDDKIALAEAGYKIIVIGRPTDEIGLSLAEVMRKVDEYYGK